MHILVSKKKVEFPHRTSSRILGLYRHQKIHNTPRFCLGPSRLTSDLRGYLHIVMLRNLFPGSFIMGFMKDLVSY